MNRLNLRMAVIATTIISMTGCASNLAPVVAGHASKVPVNSVSRELNASEGTYGSNDKISSRGEDLRSLKTVRHSSYPYIGGRMVATTNEDTLPAVFYEKYALDFGQGRTSLAVVATRLTKITGVPVRLRTDVNGSSSNSTAGGATAIPAAAGASGGAFTPMPAPFPVGATTGPGLKPAGMTSMGMGVPTSAVSSDSVTSVDAVNMKWDGKLRDFLDHLTNNLGLAWEYRDGAIVIMRMVSETYELASFPGQQKYSMATGGTGVGNSGDGGTTQSSNASMNVSQSGGGDSRTSILNTIKAMLASVPGSTANISDGTGRIVVVTSKEVQAQIRDYIRTENKSLRQMVNVTFDVYSLRTNDQDTQGIDWNLIYTNLGAKANVAIRSPSTLADTTSGGIGVSVLSSKFAGSGAIINLLRKYGTSVQHRPVSVTTLNGVWDSKTRLNTEGYLKETTPGQSGASGAAGAPGLKTDTITTGDQFAVLPMVMQDNAVMVKYSIGLSDNLGFGDVTSGAGVTLQKVQTPNIQSTNANSTIILKPGETAVITGLSRLISTADDNRLTADSPIALGGSRKLSVQRENFLVLVRATPL